MGWLAGWAKRVKITIDNNDIDAALTNFPILLYISAVSGRDPDDVTFIFDEVGANSLKIAVTEDDGVTECYVEVEKWDNGNEKAWLWTKVPSIASGADTDIYFYYDNTHANNNAHVGVTNSVPAENVWDSNFKLVSHMRDDPDNTAIRDSTSNDNDGAKLGANEPQVTVNGIIDDAQDFDNLDDEITIPDDDSLSSATSLTIEGWINPDTNGAIDHIVGKWSDALREYELQVRNGTVYFFAWDGAATHFATSILVLVPGTEYYIAGVFDDVANTIQIYINGATNGAPVAHNTIPNIAIYMTIGAQHWGGAWQSFFDGVIDEVRMSNKKRLASWLKATFETGSDDLLDWGSEELSLSIPVMFHHYGHHIGKIIRG